MRGGRAVGFVAVRLMVVSTDVLLNVVFCIFV